MRSFVIGSVALLSGVASAQVCVEKTVLGTFGGWDSFASAVTPDGRVVVGHATVDTSRPRAFRWTAEGGMQNLGTVAGIQSFASAVSADGSVVVGSSTTNGLLAVSPMRWTQATGMIALTPLRGGAVAVSDDGSIIVGNYTNANGEARGFRWTQAGGFQDLNIPSSNPNFFQVVGMSGDGSVIVGNRFYPPSGSGIFRWTQETGAVGVPVSGGEWSEAFGVSPDGASVVGTLNWANWDVRSLAFKWTPAGTIQLNNPIPRTSVARKTSANGHYVVGENKFFGGASHAFRWSENEGLIDLGTLGNTNLESNAVGVSADGSVVVGNGKSPTTNNHLGIIWRIRNLGTDFNNDGFVDFFDYDAFVTCYEGGECPSGRSPDHNGDGFVDFFDYDSFVTDYEEGC